MANVNIFDIAQPVVNEPQLTGTAGGVYAAAIVMTTYDDVFDFEHLHRELKHAEATDIRVDHQIGDVAVNE